MEDYGLLKKYLSKISSGLQTVIKFLLNCVCDYLCGKNRKRVAVLSGGPEMKKRGTGGKLIST